MQETEGVGEVLLVASMRYGAIVKGSGETFAKQISIDRLLDIVETKY